MACGKRSPEDPTLFCQDPERCETHDRSVEICGQVDTVRQCAIRPHLCTFTGVDWKMRYEEVAPMAALNTAKLAGLAAVSTDSVQKEPLVRRLDSYLTAKQVLDERHMELAATFKGVARRLLARLSHTNLRSPKYLNGEVLEVLSISANAAIVEIKFNKYVPEYAWSSEEWEIPVIWGELWEAERIQSLDDQIYTLVAQVERGEGPEWLPQ